MSAERPTPETDRQAYDLGGHQNADGALVTSDFARTLERQRDEARDELRLIDNEVAFDEAWSDGKTLHEAVGIIISQRDESRNTLRMSCDDENRLMEEVSRLITQRDRLLAALESTLEHVPITLQGEARAAIAAVKGEK